jgi:uncharacterized metal-binding protein YceD (DUF177 family)
MNRPEHAWSVPVRVGDVPEIGRHFDLIADEANREARAQMAGVLAVPRLEAQFEVTRHGRAGLRVVGEVSATVRQSCVVTLEPLENEVEEAIDLVFSPDAAAAEDAGSARIPETSEPPEPLVGGTIDLGAIATEFVVLGIDPYPRKPGVELVQTVSGDTDTKPFAALGALKRKDRGSR